MYPHNLINTFGLDCSAECGGTSSGGGGTRAVNIARRSIEMLSQRAMFYWKTFRVALQYSERSTRHVVARLLKYFRVYYSILILFHNLCIIHYNWWSRKYQSFSKQYKQELIPSSLSAQFGMLQCKQRSGRKVVWVNRSIRQLKARRYRRDITQAPVSARPYKLRLCANGACPLKICTTLSSRRYSPSHISHWNPLKVT